MPAFSYPAVFRQEVRQQRRVPQEVSTANFGLLGFTTKGPVGVPILIRDQTEYFRIFGEFTAQSITPTIASMYFGNDGQNLVMVREVGDGALPSSSGFELDVDNQTIGATSDAAPVALDVDLGNAFNIKPGSVKVFANDQVNVTPAVAIGNTVAGNTGPYTYRLPEDRYIIPATFSGVYTDTLASGNPIDDTLGDGTLAGLGAETGTIDYVNGIITVDNLASPDSLPFNATYSYLPARAVNNEIVAAALAGATIYHGKLNNEFPVLTSMVFNWTSGTVAKTATVDAVGVISGDATGTVDPVTGEIVMDIGADAPDANTNILVTYSYMLFVEATDDGSGVVNGPLANAAGTIDYEEGDLVLTVVQTTLDAQTIYVSYVEEIHTTEARDEGVLGDNLSMRITRNENSLDAATGIYGTYTVEVIENQGTLEVVLDTFPSVKLTDITDSDHIGQVINDQFTGSGSVRMKSPLTSAVPTGFSGSTKTGVLVRTPDGVTNPPLVTRLPLDGGSIVPGTLVVTYVGVDGNTYNLRDDAQGSFSQDPDNNDTGIDITTLATVNYDTGEISIVPSSTPEVGSNVTAAYTLTGEETVITADYTGGNDGAPLTRSNTVDPTLSVDSRGIYAFDKFDNMMHVALPDFAGDADSQRATLAYLTSRGDSMAILAPPEGTTAKGAVDYKRFVLGLDGQQAERGAMYWPWILIENPLDGRTLAVPPHGHVAAVWSRTDTNRNVGKAPAGVNDGGITNLRGLQTVPNANDVQTIFEGGLNAIWAPPRQSNVVWGVRTLDTTGGEYTYINKRRTMDFVSLSISRSLWWTVFENIGPELFAQIQSQITGLLTSFYKARILAGDSVDEAFFVTCDSSNNTEDTIQQGFVYIDYGIKTNTPGEFIVQRHRQIIN